MKGDTNLAPTCKWIQFQLSLFFPHTKTNTAAAACLRSPAHWSILCNQTESVSTLINVSLWVQHDVNLKKIIHIDAVFTVMAVDSSSICNMATIISAPKRLNTRVHALMHAYRWVIYTHNSCQVWVCLEVSFIIPLSVDERKACAPLALSRVLRFSLWQVRDPDIIWIFHFLLSHHDLSVLCSSALSVHADIVASVCACVCAHVWTCTDHVSYFPRGMSHPSDSFLLLCSEMTA